MTLKDEELAAIEKACAGATQGIWTHADEGLNSRSQSVYVPRKHGNDDDVEICRNAEPADARFISLARQWMPALLAEVRSLKVTADMRTRCLRVVEDTARQLDEMGEHEKAECVRTIIPRLEALP